MKISIFKDQFNLFFVSVNSYQTLHSVTFCELVEKWEPITLYQANPNYTWIIIQVIIDVLLRVLFSTTPAKLIKLLLLLTQTHKKLYNLNSLTIQLDKSEQTNVGKILEQNKVTGSGSVGQGKEWHVFKINQPTSPK